MTALALTQVTLCCVDSTPRLPWALRALRRSMEQVQFGDAFICTDRASLGEHALPEGVRLVEMAPLRSIEAYSEYMIKCLRPHVHTSHVLIVQWDGFVLHPAAWRDEFLEFDYLGAPWQHFPEPWTVGNGGFSLRSVRLLEALEAPSIVASHPEDICICQTHRAQLEAMGIRFAPRSVARYFSVEDGPLLPEVFGFHSPCHLPAVLAPDEAMAFIDSLQPSVIEAHYFGSLLRELVQGARSRAELQPALRKYRQLIHTAIDGLNGPSSLSPHALGVCKALIRYGEYAAAGKLLRRRREALGRRWAEPKLWWRLKAKSLVSSLKRSGS
ncbi:MAG: hypothetical protein H7Z15_05830 [Rhizobacter sp.]|nr:hypothetical protein [Rhizobacter sp.]